MDAADLVKRFSARTTVPIELDEVIEVLRKEGIKDEIYFWHVDIEADVLMGKIKYWDYPDGSGGTKFVADIDLAKSLDKPTERLVACKELLHILDLKSHWVSSEAAIDDLIEKLVLPPELQDPFAADMANCNSDRAALMYALAILFPKAARDELRGARKRPDNTVIANQLVSLPAHYVAVVMSDVWDDMYPLLIKG